MNGFSGRSSVPTTVLICVVCAAKLSGDSPNQTVAADDICNVRGKLLATSDRYLVELDPDTGVASLISNEGLGGYFAFSLAYDSNSRVLYTVDYWSNQLLKIDTPSHEVTVVGIISIARISGLAFDPVSDTLYGLSTSSNELVTIDQTTGSATPLMPVGHNRLGLAFDVNKGLLYAAEDDHLWVIDPIAKQQTSVGDIGFDDINGLAFDAASNTLYGSHVDYSEHLLIRIDTETGTGTRLGPLALGGSLGLAFDSNRGVLYGIRQALVAMLPEFTGDVAFSLLNDRHLSSLAYDPTGPSLYAVHNIPHKLIRIDLLTGIDTSVGSFGVGGNIGGLAFDPKSMTLYGTNVDDDILVTIDRSTGQATSVGPLGFSKVDGLAFDTLTDRLYGTDTLTDELLMIDTDTGEATPVGPLGVGGVTGLLRGAISTEHVYAAA